MLHSKNRKAGFSLVELVVVVVIIGILAAIAIPRLSRGASGASDSALAANLAAVRSAITLYHAEHSNAWPGDTAEKFVDQLTQYSNKAGDTKATKDVAGGYKYGPYLLAIPPCPVGAAAATDKAADVKVDTSDPFVPITAGGEGWIYNPDTGEFMANTDETDEGGKAYSDY